MVRLWAVALTLAGLLIVSPARADCSNVLLTPSVVSSVRRDVTARDLIELRYIGEPSVAHVIGPSPLALSPDRQSVAFVLSKPDIATDRDCQALIVLDIATGHARSVDTGGERMMQTFAVRGVRISDGSPQVVTPKWSPDGRRIGYLKRLGGVNQLWVAGIAGTAATAITTGTTDVENWAWSANGRSLIYSTRSGEAAAATAIAREGRSGYLYDERMWPDWAPSPRMPADIPLEAYVTDSDGVSRRAASIAEQALLQSFDITGHALDDSITSPAGRRASTHLALGTEVGPRSLIVSTAAGASIRCATAACHDGISDMWWDGETLVFLHREGWDNEVTGLYRWAPGKGAPSRVLATTDALLGCVPDGHGLVCTAESSAIPRHIVWIDSLSGRRRTLFDTAPEFANIRLGKVKRLRVTNAYGLQSWADLVLPPDYRPGVRLPTIVVQYSSRGFLRGGVGDEYPIFLFAARGYAVLSFQRPNVVGSNDPTIKTYEQANAFMVKDWAERRSLLSSVMASIDAGVATGIVDRTRVGITGLSDGSTTVQFAMVNSHAFAAASMSSGLFEPTTMMANGIGWANWNRRMGYPSLTEPNLDFWRPMSFVINAKSIATPLLMQVADREYTEALEGFTALREARKPVELYVFPDEYHNKRSPVHRLAIYERNLDWFDFWLRGLENTDPAKAPQLKRWRLLRSEQTAP